MTTDGPPPVRAAAPAEAEALGAILSAAFHDDPAFTWLRGRPGDDATLRGFFRALLKTVGYPAGGLDVVEDGAGAPVGAGVWVPPPQEVARLSAWQELMLLPVFIGAVGWSGLGRMRAMRAAMDRHHIDEPHWYLMFLGVAPERQGQGFGSQLLKTRLAAIDQSGLAAYLETATPRNVALYERHGFAIIAEFKPAPDAPTMWCMKRSARS